MSAARKANRNRPGYVSICRKARPQLGLRQMELLGCAPGDQLFVWQAKAQVRPIDRFPTDDQWIVGGHYVIEYKGCAVVVHIANMSDGTLTMQHMGCGGANSHFRRGDLEPKLLGIVVNDPAESAKIRQMLQDLAADFENAKLRVPHNRRGRAGA